MTAEQIIKKYIDNDALYYSIERNIFYVGFYAGLGVLDLREVRQELRSTLDVMLKTEKLKIQNTEFTNACVGQYGVSDDDFKAYFVKFRIKKKIIKTFIIC